MTDRADLLERYGAPGPLLRAGFVLSADGAATSGGSSRPLSTPADRQVFRVLRAVADVVLVGGRTARAETYGPIALPEPLRQWRREHGRPETPALAVLTHGEPPPGAIGLRGDLTAAVGQLRSLGLSHVLCEGGPALLGDLVRAGLVDELCMTLAPVLAGQAPGLLSGSLPEPLPLTLLHVIEQDGALLLRWSLRR